ncbi:MAG: CBS domain-containing protein [Lewinellaceae bacterium]|nr:CBS domain-containing protein [Saprospiraceae bacterium]MCB9313053.1 CBS domain-containing protein [Lewinellaceae bacterium]HRW75051.1 glutamate-cysteine ligase family protein [Saprospiraceae bacterium]
MGEQRVNLVEQQHEMHQFVRHLLQDVQALQYMLDHDWFESGITRMGAEQEMALVHLDTYKPAVIAPEILDSLQAYPWLTSELAAFNLECNMNPQELTGSCFSQTEAEVTEYLRIIREELKKKNAGLILTGILPTLRKLDLTLDNITPRDRYYALMNALKNMQLGSAFELRLTGIDELLVKHDTPFLEACNTSFQIHLQVHPNEFVKMYNIAQVLTAPALAAAANSPIVFGRRLWHESRIALFQQSIDTRTSHDHMRERSPRVQFGSGWLQHSIMDIYKEDIARFRVLISTNQDENSLDMVKAGKVPKLRALQVHNSTVYRWNRPCYGISPNGKPHLRIENRVIPSGPTIQDEIANAAFWLGTMLGMGRRIDDVTSHISWEDVRDNFGKVARFGIDTQLNWFDDKKVSTIELILKELLPMAREGLTHAGVDQGDMDRYLGIIEERTKLHMNGARWMLRAYTKLKNEVSQDEALSTLTASIMDNQQTDQPGHAWELPDPNQLGQYKPGSLKVEEFMTTDLFTAHGDDLIPMVTEMMDWRKIRYMPVEDEKGNLVGLITSRLLLRHYSKDYSLDGHVPTMIREIMITNPITTTQETTLVNAMNVMRDNQIGCLPVVKDHELVGIITEMDFLRVSSRLLERS